MSRFFIVLIILILGSCGTQEPQNTNSSKDDGVQVTSPSFQSMTEIPDVFTCHGDDKSPEINWSGIPEEAQSLVLIMEDPDAPLGTWVHWIVYNLPPEISGLHEGSSIAKSMTNSLPPGASLGINSWKRADYGGPCPPTGTHRYFFRLYALDIQLDVENPDRKTIDLAMNGHILGQGELVGTYQK